jgi:hypothetical protein
MKLDWLHVLRELITEVDERDNMVVDKREGDYIY